MIHTYEVDADNPQPPWKGQRALCGYRAPKTFQMKDRGWEGDKRRRCRNCERTVKYHILPWNPKHFVKPEDSA